MCPGDAAGMPWSCPGGCAGDVVGVSWVVLKCLGDILGVGMSWGYPGMYWLGRVLGGALAVSWWMSCGRPEEWPGGGPRGMLWGGPEEYIEHEELAWTIGTSEQFRYESDWGTALEWHMALLRQYRKHRAENYDEMVQGSD